MGFSLKPIEASTMASQHITRAQVCYPQNPKIHPYLQRDTAVRVAPYAHTQHIKVPKHFVYIQYGCGIQSEACCSLIHDITTLHGLRSTPQNPKSTPDLQRRITGRVAPNAHTQHIKVPKHFVYIQYNMNAGSSLKPVVASTITLQHHGLRSTPKTPKSTRDLQRGVQR